MPRKASYEAVARSKRFYEKRYQDTACLLASAQARIASLATLVEWWAPKDGVRRTEEARQFLEMCHRPEVSANDQREGT